MGEYMLSDFKVENTTIYKEMKRVMTDLAEIQIHTN